MGVHVEKNKRCSVQIQRPPSPTNALRPASARPSANDAAASILANIVLPASVARTNGRDDGSGAPGRRFGPFTAGCSEAAGRIHAAIAAGRRIVVYGDYDVDGMTGTALLWLCLRRLGAKTSYYVPHRVDEGYGLNAGAIRSLAGEGAGMIVTVDCGIGSVEEAELARSLGLELVISDHHQPGPGLPAADAIVHPALPGRSYPFAGLSGSGVAMKLAWALCQQASGAKRGQPRMREFLLKAVGLAALGTVADVVPLLDENRVLVHYGLTSLTAHPTPGITSLLHVAQLDRKPHLDSEDVAFSLAPRLNAAGRLGQPRLGVELLVTDRPEGIGEGRRSA